MLWGAGPIDPQCLQISFGGVSLAFVVFVLSSWVAKSGYSMSSLEVGSSIDLLMALRYILRGSRLLQGQTPLGFEYQFECRGTVPPPLLSVVSVVPSFHTYYTICKNPLPRQ